MKHYQQLFWDALLELSTHKMRTLLTLLGMIFGVGAVVAMLNIGKGAEQEALKLIKNLGVNNIIVNAKTFSEDALREIREDSLGLSEADAQAALATLPFVQSFSASNSVKIYDLYSDYAKAQPQALGVSENYFTQASLSLEEGRWFTTQDSQQLAQVAILGSELAKQLFPNQAALGQWVKVNHLWLEVVGVLAAPVFTQDEFQGVRIGDERNQLFLPLATRQQKLDAERLAAPLDSLKLQLAEGTDAVRAAVAIRHLLHQRHGEVDDFELVVPAALLNQQKQTQRIFNIVMACVAGISLLVGGIGIMNIMLANVLERTTEIGLLRAVGATQRHIREQFLAESFTISLLGGLIGALFGQLLAVVISLYSGWAVSWSFTAILLSLLICMLIGVGFGVFPAIKASKLNPIQALHSD